MVYKIVRYDDRSSAEKGLNKMICEGWRLAHASVTEHVEEIGNAGKISINPMKQINSRFHHYYCKDDD